MAAAQRLYFIDVFFYPFLQFKLADDKSRDYGNRQPGAHVDHCDLPSKEAPEKDHGHFIHHGRGDEKGKGDAERHTGLDETDKKRHRGAGAKRRNDAQQGGEDVSYKLSFMG